MKKLLLVILVFIGLVGGASNDALARYGRHSGHYGHGHRDGYRASECGSCHTGCGNCNSECGAPPCCEHEETITVREEPKHVCGWVCDDKNRTIPAAEASHRHADGKRY